MSTVLTREEILAADDIDIKWCPVPQWGKDVAGDDKGVFVRGLTGTERDAFEMAMLDQRMNSKGTKVIQQEINLKNLRAKLIVRCAVDSDDPKIAKTIFTPADVEALGRKNGAALQLIYSMAQRLSGLSTEDVEELTKDLGEDSSDGSGSDSPAILAILPSPSANDGSAAESSPSGLPSID